ncbi:tetraacyldisaccharide 4'-kinase [Silvibacterium sp.]|uniref:tetraacyldisaccharide 4'-kinase n=1 Tax=Silvibacterium sp. TaxID=1964179 RepID=UPI0039E60D2D
MILTPLIPIYASAIAAKNYAYDRGWKHAHRLTQPVISVGNISTGGAGKTPFVQYLAGLMIRLGYRVDVLSRGYGRETTGILRVDPRGSARDYGDEPLLLARSGVPVYVGADRYETGLFAEGIAPAAHLLDDGFQHRRLYRDADIVLMHSSDFTQQLLPSGRLREPRTALRRASIVVLRQEDIFLEEHVRNLGVTCPVWIQRRRLSPLPQGKAFAFCGIARPQEFYARIKGQGVTLVETRSFGDHQPFSASDVDQILRLAVSRGASYCVTTEKDAVRLGDELCARLRAVMPLEVPRLDVTLTDEFAAAEWLNDLMRK